jgi:hypothetical protein
MLSDRLRTVEDYNLALFHLLTELPTQGTTRREATSAFYERYKDQIPPEHLEIKAHSTKPIWKANLGSARWQLVQRGFMYGTETGVWAITEKGRRWLQENPAAKALPSVNPQATTPDGAAPREIPPNLTLEMVEQLRNVLPAEEFRHAWGDIYEHLLEIEREKSITILDNSALGNMARVPLSRTQEFLSGQSKDQPSAEELCDWIHFCYMLGLYRESVALWPFVQAHDVNEWYYERAQKIVRACRARISR